MPNTKIVGFRKNGSRVRCVHVICHGETLDIECDAAVICAGTVDSLLILDRCSEPLGLLPDAAIGSCLHDHISVPIAQLDHRRALEFKESVFPRFSGSGVVGKRFDLLEDADNVRGVLYFDFLFDQASPYKELKNLFGELQKGRRAPTTLGAAICAAKQFPKLCKIGYDRYANGRLHMDATLPVLASLFFESGRSAYNRLEIDQGGDVSLYWDFHEADAHVFGRLHRRAKALLSELELRFGLKADVFPVDLSTAASRLAYLRNKGKDGSHLGGGLPFADTINHDLSLIGTENLYVVSSAVLQTAGIPNPTFSLLALAHRLSQHIHKTGAHVTARNVV